ncbi:uncharacterized protein M421DRAFT_92546 [Didymella exigua CBS 183.55]|uniref:Uncharacterized protein n=1 Tax=Didymella exigua CBS 183.55 TaxID=1150837 RepID=A0A6A5RRZ7_9PLEO|nr:uncharacterized protein M421DRAFT_92546 [Didymella exigua CBS 183.55]KAF1928267.1 hypothetical protein M421DRAFT_92546 [Didymella exigua CBS 183.55]
MRVAQEAMLACHWFQQTRPPFQTFLTRKTSRLSIAVGLDGCGILSPANKVSVHMSIPACCGYTHTLCLDYSPCPQPRFPVVAGGTNLTAMSGIPKVGEGHHLPIVRPSCQTSISFQVKSPHLALSDATRPPVRPVATVIVFSASASQADFPVD